MERSVAIPAYSDIMCAMSNNELDRHVSLPNQPFDLPAWIHQWYEQVIPVEAIPPEYRYEIPVPGGKQILDSRIKGYTFYADVGKFKVCPEAMLDEDDSRKGL